MPTSFAKQFQSFVEKAKISQMRQPATSISGNQRKTFQARDAATHAEGFSQPPPR